MYVHVSYIYIYLIITEKLKDWNIIERYEKPFSEFEESFDEWLLTKHGAIVNYSAVSAHTIPYRTRQLRSPSSSSKVEDYLNIPRLKTKTFKNCKTNIR